MSKTLLAPGSRGFTLIELIIVVGIFAGVSMGGYTIYRVQQSSYLMQEQLAEMQQNVRAVLYFIEKDLRMAGYDVFKTGEAGFHTAKPYEVVFSADIGRPRDGASSLTAPKLRTTSAWRCAGPARKNWRRRSQARATPTGTRRISASRRPAGTSRRPLRSLRHGARRDPRAPAWTPKGRRTC